HALEPSLWVVDLRDGTLTRMAADLDLWLAPASARPWIDQNQFLATADKEGRGGVFVVDTATGAAAEVPVPDAVYSEVVPAADGRTAYALRSSYAFPEEAVRIDLGTGETT